MIHFFKTYFNQIIGIRNGDLPRPIDYQNIYWDYVVVHGRQPRANGKAIALDTLMKQKGFSEEEFNLLEQAKRHSDKLALLEEQAMYAAKGLFKDRTGQYTVQLKKDYLLAKHIMFG